MRINRYVALSTGMSRRKADAVIESGRVSINNDIARVAAPVRDSDVVKLDGKALKLPDTGTTILLNKPVGYVCSRNGQGSKTIYDLLPERLLSLKPVGRLDKDSSGLLLMTDDGDLSHRLTHPSFQKTKLYRVSLNARLETSAQSKISKGVALEDGTSNMKLRPLDDTGLNWEVSMHEGRNRQIRRTFAALGYEVKKLHRFKFGEYELPGDLRPGEFRHTTQ